MTQFIKQSISTLLFHDFQSLGVVLVAFLLGRAVLAPTRQLCLAVELQALVTLGQLRTTLEHLHVIWEVARIKCTLRVYHIVETEFTPCSTLYFFVATCLAFGFILHDGALGVDSQ